ncbi:prepilin-type N-terminal cleavage/methylation domain-containing protein [Microcella sp.]|uniref:prepilin-type N-terminal cleavage/methylation domain-containing protein n=1 Tax=Microcella sp. TaxID=1913979 RepID=UPI00299F5802|nr:prepilin-type N-terminal cleavage/methylation domain-containing protein [Microcella sp.]MDX2024734.1 prepilin-type N-terminal cleavage/methylation domain-containing protein [Microcella sp.]
MTSARTADSGFSLIELLISMLLFAVVITIVGSIILSALSADRTVRDVTGSTTDGQLVVNVIEETVRNSTAVFVDPDADGASVFAVARTTAGGAARCQAWFYDNEVGVIYEQSSGAMIVPPTPGAVGADWTQLSAGVAPIDNGAGTVLPVIALDGTRGLALNFSVDGGAGVSSLFITSATGRAPQSNVSPACF